MPENSPDEDGQPEPDIRLPDEDATDKERLRAAVHNYREIWNRVTLPLPMQQLRLVDEEITRQQNLLNDLIAALPDDAEI